ncbi:helix-turn-helix domain-containing protein [Demequina sp. NBRC 110053]|uniref:winged helix-turn-helix domain-containing protein n=1 Tax=Demequina sp. NBRC 110053 TaxID=1570342 RepID=UPI00352B539C
MVVDDLVTIATELAHVPVILGTRGRVDAHVPEGTLALPASPRRLRDSVARVRTRAAVPTPARRVGALEVSVVAHGAVWRGRQVRLAPFHLDVLTYLVDAFPRVVGSQELASECAPRNVTDGAAHVRVAIGRLREALTAAVPDAPSPIETVRGVGYVVIEDTGTESRSSSS